MTQQMASDVSIRLNHETELFIVRRNGRTIAHVDTLEAFRGSEQGEFIEGTTHGKVIVRLYRREVSP